MKWDNSVSFVYDIDGLTVKKIIKQKYTVKIVL